MPILNRFDDFQNKRHFLFTGVGMMRIFNVFFRNRTGAVMHMPEIRYK